MPAAKFQFVSVLDMFDLWRSSFDEDNRTGEPRFAQLYKQFAEAHLLILDEPLGGAPHGVHERCS